MNTVVNITGYENHPVLGRIYKEGTYVQGTEGFSRTHINSLGMREQEIKTKKKKEVRILALGDSFTEAFQVRDHKIYTNLMEAELNTRLSKSSLTVINGGRSGASPAHYLHLADFYHREVNQDYTVIQLNDKDFTEDLLEQTRNFYVNENDTGVYHTVFNKETDSIFPLLQKFPKIRRILEYSVFYVGADKAQKLMASSDFKVEQVPLEKELPEPDYDKLISWTISELKRTFPNLVIVYMPTIDFEKLNAVPSNIEILTEAYAQENHVDFINMRVPFVGLYENVQQPAYGFHNTIPGEGHTNQLGHQLIADELVNFFESRLED
jgi:hypothetical protein